MSAVPKPEIEHLKRFHLLDLMSSRHLNYLREKSIVVEYAEGEVLFSPPRSRSMGYYLLSGKVYIQVDKEESRVIEANTPDSYHSLEEQLPANAVTTALAECKVILLSRVLVEQYFSWSTTGEYKVVDIADINQAVEKQQNEWMRNLVNSPLAKNLSEEQVKEFFTHFEEERVREKDIVLHKGESSQYFYIVKSGEALSTNEHFQEMKMKVGSYFGEESIIPSAASTVHVEMLTDGVIAKVEKKHFNAYIKDSLIKYIDEAQLEHIGKLKYMVLDVRFPTEFKLDHLDGSVNIPVSALSRRMMKLDRSTIYFITRESGARGELASYMLQLEGFRVFILSSDKDNIRSVSF
ncbi:hypothetical protein TDB9533_02864 [Thalassocella blandensis]|nr:hypothetical protein TDB9533_02864 [Thalassocella blandensis]